MRSVKRVEILTGLQEFPLIERALEESGITGYIVMQGVTGKGNRKLGSVDFLTGVPESRLIKTTCDPERIDDLVEAIRPILDRYGGACVVYDAECMVLGREYSVSAGGVVRADG